MNKHSTTIEALIKQFDFNLSLAKALVEDLTEEQMTITPSKGHENHPAFTLGHLVSGTSMMLTEDLNDPGFMPEGWKEMFLRRGPGDPTLPDKDKTKYPSKEELLGELERKHNLFKESLRKYTEEELSTPVEWRFGKYMPAEIDVIVFMCVSHEAMHLGQLSAWRRAMELPSAFPKL